MLIEGLAGGSLGQQMVGLRRVRADGRRAGVVRVAARWLLWVADAAPWCFPWVGLIVGTSSRGHRRVGDMVAGTYVVRKADAGRPISW
ncbi:MAG: RDD family protein [Acidimicrobiales bacterium]